MLMDDEYDEPFYIFEKILSSSTFPSNSYDMDYLRSLVEHGNVNFDL
jgi:hypothetical protein